MKRNSEMIVDCEGIEILVGYRYERESAYCEEPGNPGTLVQPMVMTELESVEVVIRGTGIDILPNLSEKQQTYIINLLTYE